MKMGGYRGCMGICSHAGYHPDAVSHLGEPEREKHSMAQNKLMLPVIQRGFLAIYL